MPQRPVRLGACLRQGGTSGAFVHKPRRRQESADVSESRDFLPGNVRAIGVKGSRRYAELAHDPQVLGEQMQRLQRAAHKVVWVNPLKVTPGYAPLARGMAAALPYVDAFVEGHSIEAIEELARVISQS